MVLNPQRASSHPRVSIKPIASGLRLGISRRGKPFSPIFNLRSKVGWMRLGLEPDLQIVSLPDVKFRLGVFEDLNPEHRIDSVCIMEIGSRGRARTYNPSVNSRLLYH